MVTEEVISSSSQIKKEEEKEDDEYDLSFWKQQEIDGLKMCNIKKYVICTPPNNDDDKQLHMVGIVQCHTYLEPDEHLSPDHAFIFYNNNTKYAFFSRHINIDGTPTFAGYVFGDMNEFMAFSTTTGGTEEDFRKWLDAKVAENPLNSASKV